MTSILLRAMVNRPFLQAALLFCGSMLLAIAFLQSIPDKFTVDTGTDFRAYYGPVGRNIVAGNGLLTEQRTTALQYPPGYPFIIAVLSCLAGWLSVPDAKVITAFNVIGFSTTVLIVFFAAARFWGRRNALIAAGLWATYPLNLFFLTYPSPEIPFEIAFFSAMLMFFLAFGRNDSNWSNFSLCGILIGCAMLIRPIALFSSLALAFGFLFAKPSGKLAATLLASVLIVGSTLLTVLPWEIWACRQTSHIVLLCDLGPASLKDGLTFDAGDKKWRRGVPVPEDVKQMMIELKAQSNSMRTYGDVATAIMKQLKKRPLTVVELYVLKIIRSWYGTDSQRWDLEVAILQIPYLLLVGYAGWRSWSGGGESRRLAIIVGIIVLDFWFMNVMSTTIVRYAVPSMALLFLLVPGLMMRTGAPEPGELLMPCSARDRCES